MSETCIEAVARMEREKPASYLALDADTVDSTTSAEDAMHVVQAIFRHSDRVEIQRLGFTAMAPALPGALEEQEKCCEFCSTWTTAWTRVELRAGTFVLCMDCESDHADEAKQVAAQREAEARAAGESE